MENESSFKNLGESCKYLFLALRGPVKLLFTCSFISLSVALTQLVISDRTATEALREARKSKTVDVEMHCNLRYSDLLKQRIEIIKISKELDPDLLKSAVADYYREYWALQGDQFHYFQQGFITEDVYLSWINFRVREFHRNDAIGGVTFLEGWEKFGKPFAIPLGDFVDLIEYVKLHRDDERDNDSFFKTLIEKYRNKETVL